MRYRWESNMSLLEEKRRPVGDTHTPPGTLVAFSPDWARFQVKRDEETGWIIPPPLSLLLLVQVVGAGEHGPKHEGDGVILIPIVVLVLDARPVVVHGHQTCDRVQVHGQTGHLLGEDGALIAS